METEESNPFSPLVFNKKPSGRESGSITGFVPASSNIAIGTT